MPATLIYTQNSLDGLDRDLFVSNHGRMSRFRVGSQCNAAVIWANRARTAKKWAEAITSTMIINFRHTKHE